MFEVEIKARMGQKNIEATFETRSGVTALFGQSGVGKTSLLKTLIGSLKPLAGKIKFRDQVFYDKDKKLYIPIHKRYLGVVFQTPRLFPHMSVLQNLTFARKPKQVRGDAAGFDDIVELLGLGDLLQQRPYSLSGGEAQRVAIGRALLSHPKALLMDEPLANLDYSRKQEILPYLKRVCQNSNLPILYVSHSVDEIMALADETLLMEDGKVVASGKTTEILSTYLMDNDGQANDTFLQAEVIEHDEHYGLSSLKLGPHKLVTSHLLKSKEQQARLRIPAKDIILAANKPEGISARNILPVEVQGILELDHIHALINMKIENTDTQLRARITRKSLEEMSLTSGANLYALVKVLNVD